MTTSKKRTGSWTPSVLAAALTLAMAGAARAATYTVVNTADSGAGSLRQAITDANANGGTDTIAFNIPGSGVHTIEVPSLLPVITSPVVIDGTTQPGYAGSPLIELHGAQGYGFQIQAGGSTVRGLVVGGFGTSILLQNGGANLIQGCYIGTDATGTVGASPGGQGIRIIASDDNVIGGTSPGAGNLVSGNGSVGIGLESSNGTIIQGNLVGTDVTGTVALPNGAAITLTGDNTIIGGSGAGAGNLIAGNLGNAIQTAGTGVVIQGNFIGTDITGTRALGNGMGVNASEGADTTIGGSGPGEGNLISGNHIFGIYVYNGAVNTTIQGNLIGTDVSGTLPLGNVTGVASSNVDGSLFIGGTGPGEGNVIAFNSGYVSYSLPVGVLIYQGTRRATIRGNSIHDNELLGISFNGGGGPTPNDPDDSDVGGNDLLNFPIVRSVVHGASSTEIVGKYHSAPSTTYTLDFYANPACTRFPRDFDEGETWLGSEEITTDAAGHKEFDITLPVATVDGAHISVTATDPLGNTSEFSQRIIFSISPSYGDAAGGAHATVFGTDFDEPLSLSIGGLAADFDFIDDHTLYPVTPALPAGSVNDVVVTTSDGTTGILVKGFVADFLDVPSNHQFHDFVTRLVSNAITVGIGGGLYGVDQPTKRQQMAALLLKARHGLCFVPPPCTGLFDDVPCPSTFAAWIEAMANEGITGGCGNGNFCPETPVRRDQMAVFLLKAEHGSDYVPPQCTGVYADVPCPSAFAPWIEQLGAEGITGGCGNGNYCPASSNTRGQMAVFLVKTFNLPK